MIDASKLNYDSPSALRDFLNANGMTMQKKFGQNFLINPRVRARLLDALDIQGGEDIWEAGAGLGAMTAGLLSRGAKVTAFEIDRGFCAILKKIFGADKNFRLVEGDMLDGIFSAGGSVNVSVEGGAQKNEDYMHRKLFGNLPYNIAARLLAQCIEKGLFFSKIVITVQREVARRLSAKTGDADYSSLSVLTALAYKARRLGTLSGEAFFPPPHVESQSLVLNILPEAHKNIAPPVCALIRALFSSRRKTLKNNLSRFLHSEERALAILEQCRIAPNERAERLSPADFRSISDTIRNLKDEISF